MKLVVKLPKTKLKAKSINLSDKDLIKIIEKRVKEVSSHFKNDGWKLNKTLIESDILFDIFGCEFSNLVDQALCNKGLVVEYNAEGSFIRTKEPYCPIFMNVKTGKIHLVTNSDDKSYIFKFSESNGFVEIGKL